MAKAGTASACSANCISISTTCFRRPSGNRSLANPPPRKSSTSEGHVMRTLIVILSLFGAALAAPEAQAHAFLDHASPLVGSTVPAAPHEVALTFTQNLEPAFSSVEVMDGSGARVDQGKAAISGNTMHIGLKAI